MSDKKHQVYLCSAQRTPIGSFSGSLSAVPAPRLGGHVIGAVLNQTKLEKQLINEVIMGCVLTAGLGQAPARQASIYAGLPESVQAMTINKVCSSGLKAVMLAANTIQLSQADAIIAGGMENMSLAPYLLPKMRSGARLGHTSVEDSILRDGLWEVYRDYHMGSCAELCAREFKISREEQDQFAVESYARASASIKQGVFKEEIATIKVKSGKQEIEVLDDEEPLKFDPTKISALKPVFEKEGTVTAANASSLSDGAAAMLVCSENFLKKHNLTPMARIVSQGWHAQAPEWFTTAPVGALEHALRNANLKISEIDLFEVNEAFSAVAIACRRKLEIDPGKLNVNGGAVALGHPIGASGARLLTTLLYSLKRRKTRVGAVAICNGGGEATAMIIEQI